jgi:hypothetical protein
MDLKSKRNSLIILGITSIICSRIMFSIFNDPEGPNLLIVLVTAFILFVLSLKLYLSNLLPKFAGLKRLLLVIFIQIVIIMTVGFWLK